MMMRKRLASSVLAATTALAVGAGPAGAHGGDAALVHSCIDNAGNVKIVAADATCKKNELPLDWARDAGAAGPTYSAGSGLSLSPTNEFSVTGAPWDGLTGVPAGFADGVDDEGPALTWGNLTGIPNDLLDGDNDGTAKVNELRGDLANSDGTPNQDHDPVSFTKIKDLTTTSGDGRITGEYIRNGSLTGGDLAERTISGGLIADDSIETRHLADGVLDRSRTTTTVDPDPIPAGSRVGVPVTAFGPGFDIDDITVVSPPASLESGLVYAGSDVLADGTLVVYLHNITAAAIDGSTQTWTIRRLRTGG
jgi:hypothetical protein